MKRNSLRLEEKHREREREKVKWETYEGVLKEPIVVFLGPVNSDN